MANRKTLPEQLDAAKDGEEFGKVITGFFAAWDKTRWADEADDDDDE